MKLTHIIKLISITEFFYLCTFWILTLVTGYAQVSPQERQALVDLYNATAGDSWKNTTENNQPWLINDANSTVDTWYGVTVSGGKVTKLILNKNTLTGTIPNSITDLTGLTELDLGWNSLSGTIPSAIGQLLELRKLSLYRNQLTGSIPASITSLTKLTNLSLFFNQLSGTIPTDIGSLQNLVTVHLGLNKLQGALPISIGNLAKITYLYLGNNDLEGELPNELGNLINLGTLVLSENNFTGTIPSSIGGLNKLFALSLHKNQLSGAIPETFGGLVNMQRLYISYNQLTGSIPVVLGNLPRLQNLQLSNNQLTGAIPTSFNQLTDISYLDLHNNNLSNTISLDVSQLTKLKTFYMNGNTFVFSDFEANHSSYLQNITTRYLYNGQSKTDEEETITIAEGESITLTSTALSSTNNIYQWYKNGVAITGATSKNLTITNVTTNDAGVYHYQATNTLVNDLVLTRNPVTVTVSGSDPVDDDACGVSESQKQALLDLYTNTNGANWTNTLANDKPWDINTPVCEWFGVTVVEGTVTEINLSSNQLRGTIPASISDLSDLRVLSMNGNTLSGSIPNTIGQLTELRTLSLFRNQLTGSLPVSIINLTKLTTVSLYLNQLSGEIPTDIGNLTALRSLHLGLNDFQGSIPASLGNLTNIIFLNIAGNELEGTIPRELANLTKVTQLSIGSNNLSGKIPNELTALTGLVRLNFKDNKFVFSDFEQDHTTFGANAINYEYTPQSKTGQEETISAIEGCTITLTNTVLTSPNNTYQWFKTVNGTTTEVTGATAKDLVISNATVVDSGSYHCIITNTIVTGLTLERHPITVAIMPDTCTISASERQALWDIYNATNGSNWTNTTTGNQAWSDCVPICDWYGVTVVDGKVTQLNLENNMLQGTIPSSISSLVNLTSLDLNTNALTGEIPPSLGALLELTYLSLHHNNLSGTLSPSLGSLSSLTVMDLSHNGTLSGPIPIAFCNLANLTILNLSNNALSGGIPKELGILTKLVRLDLNNNQLEGTIPNQLTSLIQLEFLGLSSNILSGVIPFTAGASSKLRTLTFDNNYFIFSDFESKYIGYTQNVNGVYQYAPQAKTDIEEVKTVTVGSSITLTAKPFSANNSYQWYKDNVLISGANTREYTIASASLENAGAYFVVVTNSVIDDLVLTRNTITLDVKDTCNVPATERQALIDLYTAVGGANWNNTVAGNQPWFVTDANSSVCDWYGVIVRENRVVELHLADNNLVGMLPNIFEALPALKEITVNDNKLQGMLAPSIAELGNLEVLAIENNTYIFEDFETQMRNYVGITFTYSPQSKVDEAVTETIDFGASITLTSTQLTSIDNSYQWFRNGLPMPNATSKDLVITNATTEDSGMYFFAATNFEIADLTLMRNPISLTVRPEGDLTTEETERQALIDLYNSTNGSNWVNNTSWLTDAPLSDWHGVTVVDGKVTKIVLVLNGLTGTLPESIGNLVNVEVFNLYRNNIEGNIPASIGNMKALEVLDLGVNKFIGEIPSSLKNAINLQTLNLFRNRLTGTIPLDLGDLSNLEVLNLFENTLTGSIPATLGNLPKLKRIALYINQLTGTIPTELGNLSALEVLHLERNAIEGEIPVSLGNLTSLHTLQLGNNRLTGTIPKELGNLSELKTLYLYWNQLTGIIPEELGNLQKLEIFGAERNALEGQIPPSFGTIATLKVFHVPTNNLTGRIPESFGSLPLLENLNVAQNHFSGTIPSLLGSLATSDVLNSLVINNNNFVFKDFESEFVTYKKEVTTFGYTPQAKVDTEETRTIARGTPVTLTSNALTSTNNSYQWYKNGVAIQGATTKEYTIENVADADAGTYHFVATNSVITDLTLTRNPITLQVVEPGACAVSEADRQTLVDFYQLTNGDNWSNTIAGNQPWLINDPTSKVCDWYGVTVSADFKVTGIEVSNNNVRGGIPTSLGGLKDLKVINLSQNNVVGDIPVELANLKGLEVLNLRENVLVGAIPEEITTMSSLQVLDLGTNRIPSEIPATIGELQSLTYLDLSDNKLEGEIPEGLWTIGALKEIKLQENKLKGIINDAIGNLPQLEVFWVSNNNFNGNIPQTITLANTPNLYSIHLDFNGFSGDLPQLIPNLSLPNTSIQINDNAFIFNDFESEFVQYQTQLSNFVYSPQAMVDQTELECLKIGGNRTLTTNQLVSINNRYQWYKRNDQGIFESIPGATSKDYIITNITNEEFGVYRFIATNTVVTGLELTRRTITLVECVDNEDDYTFCNSLSSTSIGDLPVPNGGSIALWFENETDTQPIPVEEEVFESQTLWAEVDGNPGRIAVPILLNEGAPGIFETLDANGVLIDESFQVFNPNLNPTIANLQITPSQGITWHATATSTAVLPLSTPLEHEGLYYAALNGHPCRFEVEVFLGIPDIFADGIQYFCKADDPMIASIQVVRTDPSYEVRWYDAETGGTLLSNTTPLEDGKKYFVTQFDGSVESEVRTSVEVVIYDVQFPEYFTTTQTIFVKDGQIATIADLLDRDPSIRWYQTPEGDTLYRPTDPLVDGDTYYAAQVNREATCESDNRIAVTINIVQEQPPILVGCEKFKPQPGDRYVMSGWVREQGVRITSTDTRNFITDTQASDRLLQLLNHLVKDFALNEEPKRTVRFIKDAYIPDIENKVYDAILPYVTNGPTDNLTIYNFQYVQEDRISQGYERTIGFQFSFSPDATGDEHDFRYVTPAYESGSNPQRYPLFNNPSIEIEFTGFATSGNTLQVISSFSIDTSNPGGENALLNGNTSNHRTNFSNISLTNDFHTYEPNLDYQAMDYANSLIEVVYEDEEGTVLNLDASYRVAFKPKGAIIDGWQRISADFVVPSEAAFMSIVLKNTNGDDINSYFDDIRMHPFDSNMKTFVYDPITQRLQSELDENNYATFYEYDKEGGLVRVKKETERGIYTIQETRSGNVKRNN